MGCLVKCPLTQAVQNVIDRQITISEYLHDQTIESVHDFFGELYFIFKGGKWARVIGRCYSDSDPVAILAESPPGEFEIDALVNVGLLSVQDFQEQEQLRHDFYKEEKMWADLAMLKKLKEEYE